MAAGTAADKRTIVQRLIDIAKNVGVLEPEKSGGVPFAFRGVDAVVAKLTPLLNENGVIVVPQESRQILSQREVGAKVVTKADVEVTYRFYGAEGDFLDVQVVGQADDFADRSSAQAMSVAFRIALLQTFHIAAFGNEEAASEATKNEREAGGGSGSGNSKIDKAKEASAKPKVDPAAQMRDAILAAAAQKGWEPDKINEFATDVTGVDVDAWFNDPDKLNLILSKINEAK